MPVFVYRDDTPSSPDRDPQNLFLLTRTALGDRSPVYTVECDLPSIMGDREQLYCSKASFRRSLEEIHRASVEAAYETQKALDSLFGK